MWLLGDVMEVVINRRAMVDGSIDAEQDILLTGTDISARDNGTLAQAAGLMVTALTNLRDRQVIDDAELLRMIYKFSGEDIEVEAMLARGRKAGIPLWPGGPGIAPSRGGPEAPGGPPQGADAAIPKAPGIRTVGMA
jgi:hypothetical protein